MYTIIIEKSGSTIYIETKKIYEHGNMYESLN